MATLASIGTGNFLTAGTWGLVDPTSIVLVDAGNDVLSTAYSSTRSSAFTPGAITVSHIGVKLAVRTGTTGTISVNIEKDSDDSQVAGTEVTINVADLPVAATADNNGGWHLFKLATPVTLAAATAYQLAAKTSTTAQVSLFNNGVTDNMCRVLVTTTTQAPAAGDDMIVAGEYTGAGTSNSFVVTMNETATTDYGSAPTAANSLLSPGIAVCNKGTLSVGTAAATNYNLKLSNSLIVYSGGTLNFGTTGTPIPRDSSFTLQFDPGTNVDYGLTIRNLGTWNSQGLSRTSGKNIYYCKLNTDEAINSTSLGVDTDTGWLDNDVIVVASTTQTAAHTEMGALNGSAGASTLTVDGFAGAGGGLAFAHSGTSPTQAEIINITRNVLIRGASATLQAYIKIDATATVDIDWSEFKWLGSATTTKRGIDVTVSTGSFTCHYSSIHDFIVSASLGININSASGNAVTVSNNVFYNIFNNHLVNVATTGTHTYDSNVFLLNGSASFPLVSLADIGGTFTNNMLAGGLGGGVNLNESGAVIGTVTGNIIHACGLYGINIGATTLGGTISGGSAWRNGSTGGVAFSNNSAGISNVVFDGIVLFGNNTTNINITGSTTLFNVLFQNIISNGDTSFGTSNAVSFGNAVAQHATFINCDFGTVAGIKTGHTADFNMATTNSVRINAINCKLQATATVGNQTSMTVGSFVTSQKHNQVAGTHKSFYKYGTITIDTGTVQAGTASMKMTPNNASNKFQSIGPYGGFKVAVASGQTCTPSVYVYEDAAYNGARARLFVRRNDALGITADTLLDTATAASDAAWEQLTGTTIAVTDAGTLEFYVDCDGNSGNLFVDTFSATVA